MTRISCSLVPLFAKPHDPRIIIGDVTLYLGDCLDALKTLPDGSVDACVVDPPYGLSFIRFSARDPGL